MPPVEESIGIWSKDAGLFPVNQPKLTVDMIVQFCGRNINEIPMEEFETIIVQGAAYNIWLKSMKGTLSAKMNRLQTLYNKKLGAAIQRIPDSRFKSKEEKEAIALDTYQELGEVLDKLEEVKMKYLKIKEIPMAIDSALSNIKMAYTRRLNEVRKQ